MNKKLFLIVNLINGCLISLLLVRIFNIDSDKAITLLFFYYPFLLVLNFLAGVAFLFINHTIARIFFKSVAVLFIALLPVLVLAGNF